MRIMKHDAGAPGLFEDSGNETTKPKRKRVRQEIPAEQLENLHLIEDVVRAQGYVCLAGIDEAGRGPLAGPVVAAAVVFAPETFIAGINDSKKLSEKKRFQLFEKPSLFQECHSRFFVENLQPILLLAFQVHCVLPFF